MLWDTAFEGDFNQLERQYGNWQPFSLLKQSHSIFITIPLWWREELKKAPEIYITNK